jgi:peptidoglycan/xylan/chitin deacetylase (PgdA/CDA1 family)
MSDPRLSVCLSFDFDAMSSWIGSFQTRSLPAISRGEFGAHAVPRILEMLRRRDVTATFFIPGHTALAFPNVVRAIHADGHEIGHHGWVHENPAELDLAEERVVLEKGFAALDKVVGVVPRGYRSPGADFSENTADLLREYGFRYDSSCSASDFTPYYLRKNDRFSLTEPYVFGELTDLVELPFFWTMDDFPHFEFVAGFSTAQSTPTHVRELWQGEFDYAYDNAPGGVYDLCMHPQAIGRGSRLTMLEELIVHMQSREDVAFETMVDYADRWKAANPVDDWRVANPERVGAGAYEAL